MQKQLEEIDAEVEHWLVCFNKGLCCLYLRKAFDSLDHCLLLQRIFELGVRSTVVEWFKDYLSNRYHRVKSSANFSSW